MQHSGHEQSIRQAQVEPPPSLVPFDMPAPRLSGPGTPYTSLQITIPHTAPREVHLQWQVDGIDLIGETETTYIPQPGDIGRLVTCLITTVLAEDYSTTVVVSRRIRPNPKSRPSRLTLRLRRGWRRFAAAEWERTMRYGCEHHWPVSDTPTLPSP